MTRVILVSFKRHNRVEEFIPYLEEVAQPGMRVIFLIPYPVESSISLRDYWVTTESAKQAMLAGKKIMEAHCWELQKRLAEQKLSPAREILARKGVEVAVDICTGSLRKVVKDYTAKGDVHLIMMQAENALWIRRLLWRMSPIFGHFKQPGSSPVLLVHPG